jgi:hypothetical protein
MDRRLPFAAALLALIVGIAACRPVDGGAGGSDNPSPQASAAESVVAPGNDDGY